jgi:hypothetical protein
MSQSIASRSRAGIKTWLSAGGVNVQFDQADAVGREQHPQFFQGVWPLDLGRDQIAEVGHPAMLTCGTQKTMKPNTGALHHIQQYRFLRRFWRRSEAAALCY